ncbi:MAG: hypothetical protein K2K63_07390 [Acetatifactor sp.]|nr:hypothetical protein [Acetatifactor sp.]
MSFLDKYFPVVSRVTIGKEEMLNVCDLVRCMEADGKLTQIEECIAVPFYIDAGKTYELYQYEFRIEEENGDTFEEYMLRVTGKKTFEGIPNDIIKTRRICFVNNIRNDQEGTWKKIKEYFDFLLHDKDIRQVITGIFNEFEEKKLFISFY